MPNTLHTCYHTAHKQPTRATAAPAPHTRRAARAPAVGANVYAKLLVGFGAPLTLTVAMRFLPGGLLVEFVDWLAGRMEKRWDMECMTPWVELRKRRK